MGDAEGDSGSENSEAPQVDWASLEGQLSAGALESLREHLQVTSMLTPEVRCLCPLQILQRYNRATHSNRCICNTGTSSLPWRVWVANVIFTN